MSNVIDIYCDKCGDKFQVDTDDIPCWQETFLCPRCEDQIGFEMEECWTATDEEQKYQEKIEGVSNGV